MTIKVEEPASPPSLIHDAIMQAWTCAFGETPVVYLSGPITTGPRFLDQLHSGQSDAERRVFEQNCADLVAAAARLRIAMSETVVEPASLSVPGWSQADYIGFWEEFIARRVRLVLFMPGWQLSAGCAAEFARATECGIATETIDGQPLDAVTALPMLKAAAKHVLVSRGTPAIDRLLTAIDGAIIRIQTVLSEAAGHDAR